MSRRRRVFGIAVAVALLFATVLFASPAARGGTLAVLHLVRGKSALYTLGCVVGPSYDPTEFRFEELLAQKYNLFCETTGGFAPSDEILKFTGAYNGVTVRVAQLRYGRDFVERTHREAERDVVVQPVVLKGCYRPGSGQLELPSGERVHLRPSLSETLVSDAEQPTPIVVIGKLTKVRAGDWNRWMGPMLRPSSIQADPGGVCQ